MISEADHVVLTRAIALRSWRAALAIRTGSSFLSVVPVGAALALGTRDRLGALPRLALRRFAFPVLSRRPSGRSRLPRRFGIGARFGACASLAAANAGAGFVVAASDPATRR